MTELLAMLPISLTSGINLYLTLFTLGLGGRMGYFNLPDGLSVLESWPVLIVAGFFMLVEFFVDKIPYADTVWDFLHTIVRPLGAVLLSMNAFPDTSPDTIAAMNIVAGSSAFGAHGSKATIRAFINTSPEPVSNAATSTAEDALVVGLILFAFRYPVLAGIISAILLTVMIVLTILIIRWARRTYKSVWAFLRNKREPMEQSARNLWQSGKQAVDTGKERVPVTVGGWVDSAREGVKHARDHLPDGVNERVQSVRDNVPKSVSGWVQGTRENLPDSVSKRLPSTPKPTPPPAESDVAWDVSAAMETPSKPSNEDINRNPTAPDDDDIDW
jgi:hypothetical protein